MVLIVDGDHIDGFFIKDTNLLHLQLSSQLSFRWSGKPLQWSNLFDDSVQLLLGGHAILNSLILEDKPLETLDQGVLHHDLFGCFTDMRWQGHVGVHSLDQIEHHLLILRHAVVADIQMRLLIQGNAGHRKMPSFILLGLLSLQAFLHFLIIKVL